MNLIEILISNILVLLHFSNTSGNSLFPHSILIIQYFSNTSFGEVQFCFG